MPDENRVFDVAKPGRQGPTPTSRPVIVGHQPEGGDPMMKPEPKPISVQDASEDYLVAPAPQAAAEEKTEEPAFEPVNIEEPASGPEPSESSEPIPQAEPEASFSDEPPAESANTQAPHVEELPILPPQKKRGKLLPGLLVVLILLVGGYLFVDSGVVDTGIKLPVHVFKQKTVVVVTPPAKTNQTTTQSAVPAGFTKYQIDGTAVTFAAPTAWGSPTSSTKDGYTARGGTNKPDGAYAYVIDFATNKDVEVAVTSAKYLPPAAPTLYYDYLQWCTGTSDSKTYLATLHFTTSANKIDTPSTVVCDQGPVTSVTSLDSTTIVQLNAKTTDGKNFGDLYTKNLASTDLVVFRVKDATSTNGVQIKKLLLTVKSPSKATAVTGTSSSSSQSQ